MNLSAPPASHRAFPARRDLLGAGGSFQQLCLLFQSWPGIPPSCLAESFCFTFLLSWNRFMQELSSSFPETGNSSFLPCWHFQHKSFIFYEIGFIGYFPVVFFFQGSRCESPSLEHKASAGWVCKQQQIFPSFRSFLPSHKSPWPEASLKLPFKAFHSSLGVCVFQKGFILGSWIFKLHKIPSVSDLPSGFSLSWNWNPAKF